MSKSLRIVRSKHDAQNKYFLMSRSTAQDRDLSFEARGMLAYILSKPDDWIVQIADLEQHCGETRVYRILKELRTARYVELVQIRNESGSRVLRWEYRAYETPLPPDDPLLDGFQDVENLDVENLDVENHHTYRIERITKERTSKKESRISEESDSEKKESTESLSPSGEPAQSNISTKGKNARPPSKDKALKDSVAIFLEKIDPSLAGKRTGYLAAAISAVWKRRLKVDSLTVEEYEKIARSVPLFAERYCEDHTPSEFEWLIKVPANLESEYAKLLPELLNERRKQEKQLSTSGIINFH